MRLIPGFSPLLLGGVLMAACSDDGFINQSSGQAETSTTGNAASDGPADLTGSVGDPSATSGPEEGTSAAPPATTSGGSDGTAAGSDTSGLDIASGTDTSTGPGTGSGTIDTDTEGTTTGGPQPCAEGCAVEVMCGTEWMSEEECVMWCEANLMKAEAFSPFCRLAWEGVSTCLATLTCEEFAVWESPMMFPYPCSDADVVLAAECKGQ
jgi:hypothetical protein